MRLAEVKPAGKKVHISPGVSLIAGGVAGAVEATATVCRIFVIIRGCRDFG